MTIPLKMKTMMYKSGKKSPVPLYLVLKLHSSVLCFIFLTLLVLHFTLSSTPGNSFVNTSTLSDVILVLLQMNESNELRYELDINNKLLGDIETATQRWYAGLRFYGNDPEHSLNADMCNFLSDLQENRERLESYFTGKDMYDMWKKQTLECYTAKPVTHKEIE